VLTATPDLADYFEDVVKAGVTAKTAANWIETELLRRLNDSRKEIGESPVTPSAFAELLKLIETGQIPAAIGKKVLERIWETGGSAEKIIVQEGLVPIRDLKEILEILNNTILAHQGKFDQLHEGKESVKKSIIGEAMRLAKGKVDPKLMLEQIEKLFDLWEASTYTVTVPAHTIVLVMRAKEEKMLVTVADSLAVMMDEIKRYPELWSTLESTVTTGTAPSESGTKERRSNDK
jgi:hypothetical protein